MNKTIIKNFFCNFIILITIFLIDRISKFYILKLAEFESSLDIYVTSYLNLFLIWNKGIAFGLLSMNESLYQIFLIFIFMGFIGLFLMWQIYLLLLEFFVLS